VRKCIPYKAPDVSPYERPLTSAELADFSRPFASSEVRAFSLPFVNTAQVVPSLRRFVFSAYRYDQRLLSKVPALTRFSGIRVMHAVK
jgi:hypothetical protein